MKTRTCLTPDPLVAAIVAFALLVGDAGAQVAELFPITISTSLTASSPKVIAYEIPREDTGYYPTSSEYGVVATLDPTAPNILRTIVLPYYSDYAAAGGLTVRVYENNGPEVNGLTSPGQLLSTFKTDIIGGGSISILTAQYTYNVKNQLPPSVTVTVQFDGVNSSKHAGWMVTSADARKGIRYNYYWERPTENALWTPRTFAPPAPPKLKIKALNPETLEISVTGTEGITYVLERSHDLKSWSAVQTNSAGGFEFIEGIGPSGEHAFYRGRPR